MRKRWKRLCWQQKVVVALASPIWISLIVSCFIVVFVLMLIPIYIGTNVLFLLGMRSEPISFREFFE